MINFLFYSKYIKSVNDFLGNAQKEIKYKDIKDLKLTQNIVDKIYNVGKIKILTTSSSNNTGIYLVDIENPKENYEKIKRIINENINK